MTTFEALQTGLQTRLSGAAGAWFAEATGEAVSGTRERLLQLYTGVSRQLGHPPLALGVLSGFPPPTAAGLTIDHWTIEDAARLALLMARSEGMAPDEFAADALACYELGDAREQQSWLKAVVLLPSPEHYLPYVIDACRTNILPQFEAVACENPYPEQYFPERNFNQVVMKALFNRVSLARIVGLARRANAELARMATDFAAERTAAGRAVPDDIGLAMAGAATRTHV